MGVPAAVEAATSEEVTRERKIFSLENPDDNTR